MVCPRLAAEGLDLHARVVAERGRLPGAASEAEGRAEPRGGGDLGEANQAC